jgi:hypothetical protein
MSDIDPFKNSLNNECLSPQVGSFFVSTSTEDKKDISTTSISVQPLSNQDRSKSNIDIDTSHKGLDIPNNKLLCTPKSKTQSKRCSNCNKRLSLSTEYVCKCAGIFCTKHRFPDSHGCTFDHKEHWKKSLEQKNPQVVAEKISKI